MSTRPCTGLA